MSVNNGGRDERTDPIPGIDLADPRLYRLVDVQGIFADLRREHPVFWHGLKSHIGFWSVTRYADVVRVYRDADTFTCEFGMTLDTVSRTRDPAAGLMLELTDPPRHGRLRRAIGGLFSARAVSDLWPAIDDIVVSVLTEIHDRNEPVDFVTAVARPIPTRVAGLLLGLPTEDLDWISGQAAQVFRSDEQASVGQTGDVRMRAAQANADLLGYLTSLVRSSAGGSAEAGLVQRLVADRDGQDALSTAEVILNSLNLAIAGTQTTRHVMTSMMLALIQFPETFGVLREEPALLPRAVEEAVRWGTPGRHLARTATRHVELGGKAIAPGDPVIVWPFSANRDELVFRLPHVFDIRRRPNPHIGFATGTHRCVGAGLARLQLRATFARLVEFFAAAEPAGTPQLAQSNFLLGHERLPVRFTPSPSQPSARRGGRDRLDAGGVR